MAVEINGKVYRNLQEQVEKNKEDIEEIVERGGKGYTAGDGIDITEDVISVDDTVALKSELTNYVTLDGNQTITGVKTFGEVHVTDAYGNCDVNSYKISLNKEESDHDREVAIYLGNVDASFIQYRKTVPGSSGTSVNNTYLLPHQDVTGVHDYTLATTADIPYVPEEGHYMYVIHIFFHNDRDYRINVPITSSYQLTGGQVTPLDWEEVLPYISDYTMGIEDEYNADFGLMGYFYGVAQATTNRYFSWMGNDHNDLTINESDHDLDITMEDVTVYE